jgi:hypothetical protein
MFSKIPSWLRVTAAILVLCGGGKVGFTGGPAAESQTRNVWIELLQRQPYPLF